VGSTTGSSVSVTSGAAGSFILTLNATRDGVPVDCSKTVTVLQNPTCSISGSTTVCAGASGIAYSATVSPIGGTVTYAWSITGSGSIVGSTTGSSVSVDAGAAGSFTLTVDVARDGCPGQCSTGVTVIASPICSISGPDPVEPGSTGNAYSAAVSPTGGTVAYVWSIGGNGTIVGSTTASSVSVDAGGAGSFTLTCNVTRNGCPGQCQKIVTVETATVAATIQASGTSFTPSQVTIQEGESVKWQWVDGSHTTTNGVSSAPEHSPGTLWDASLNVSTPTFTYQFNQPGYYPFFCRPHELMEMKGVVIVEDSGPVGIGDELPARLRFSASPNPFTSSTRLAFELDRPSRVSLDVFDIEGRLVLNLLLADLPAGPHEVRWGGWDAMHHPVSEGMYVARLITEGGEVLTQKVLKSR
jgi:plastocyanin